METKYEYTLNTNVIFKSGVERRFFNRFFGADAMTKKEAEEELIKITNIVNNGFKNLDFTLYGMEKVDGEMKNYVIRGKDCAAVEFTMVQGMKV